MKKMQRIGALLLAVVMVCASVFAQPAFMSNAANENEMSIAYDKVDGGFFNFQGTLSSGQTLQAAGYNWSTASGMVQAGTKQTGGAIDWVSFTVNNNLSFVAGGENLIIWYDTLVANNYDAIKIEEGTVFTFSGKTSVKVTNTLYLEKNEAGVWEDKSEGYFDGNEMSIAFDKVDAGNCFNFQGTLSNGKTLAESGYDWSLASGTIQAAKKQAGSLDWADYPLNTVLSFAAGDGNLIILYDTVIASDYDAIQIAEGSIFTFDGKTKVKITNTLELEKNSAGVWGLKSDEPEVSELGLSFDKMTDAWYFNADVTPEADYYRVEMEVDGTKYTVPISNTKDGKFVIWPDFFTNIGGAPNAPTNTLKIAKGATLAPSSDAWVDSPTGTRYTLKEDISLEYYNGAWVAEGSVPKEMGLTFEELTDKWVFVNDVTPEAKFYRVEMEIDGTNYTVPIENTKDGKFVIWASYFTDIGGAVSEPTNTLKIAKGATLVPSTDAWTDDATGTRYVLKEAIDLTYEYGAWGVAGRQIEVSQITLDAYSWGGGSDGVIGITIGNLEELQATAWYPTIVTETNTTWGKLHGTVLVDGQPKEVDVQIPGNGEIFIYYDAAEIPESFVIQKDTDFIPVAGSANLGKYAIQFKEDYGVNLTEKLVGGPGVHVDYCPLDITKMSVSSYADQTEQNRSYIMFKVEQDLLSAGADWWNNYDATEAIIMIDGVAHTVQFGGGGAEDILALYLPWDAEESDILASAEEIVIKSGSKTNVGLQGLQFANDLKLVKKYGAWLTQAEADRFEETTISLGAYSWSEEGVIGIKIENLAQLENTVWYQNIVTEDPTTWGKLSGTVSVGNNQKLVDIQFPGNGEVFIYYNPTEVTDSMVVSKDTLFTTVTGSAGAGKYNVRFAKDYGVNVVEKLVGEPGIRVEYRSLDVTKLSIASFGDQAELKRSYIQFSTEDTLLPAGADWWNNYDSVSAVVLVDGIEYDVMFGGGGSENTLAMYLQWNRGEKSLLEDANEIVIKKNAQMSVGLQGLTTEKDLTLKRVGTIWVSEYKQEDAKPAVPSNALKVNIQFGQITGQNILGIKTEIKSNKRLLDIYGDWSTAYGSIKLGVLDDNGKIVYTTIKSTIYSISDNIYLSGVDLSLYDAVLIEAGTVLQPDSSLCKSDTPLVLMNEFAMERNADDEWKVTAGAVEEVNMGNASDKNTTDSNTSDSTGDTENESNETETKPADEYDGTTMIHRKDAEDKDDVPVGNSPSDGSIGIKVAVVALAVLVIAATVVVCIVAKNRKKDS